MPRSVTRPSEFTPSGEMSVVGTLLAAAVALLLVPLLPFVAAYWLLVRLADVLAGGEPDASWRRRRHA